VNGQRIADAVTEMIMKGAVHQQVAVETILRQLVDGGHSLADVTYKHLPDLGKDLLVCKEVCVLLIQRTYEGPSITIKYTIYPDGRPGGWPELNFASAEQVDP
jgi:hypothetical protein